MRKMSDDSSLNWSSDPENYAKVRKEPKYTFMNPPPVDDTPPKKKQAPKRKKKRPPRQTNIGVMFRKQTKMHREPEKYAVTKANLEQRRKRRKEAQKEAQEEAVREVEENRMLERQYKKDCEMLNAMEDAGLPMPYKRWSTGTDSALEDRKPPGKKKTPDNSKPPQSDNDDEEYEFE